MNEAPRTLPRRSNTIRSLAAAMAHKKMTEVGQRQAVSDRIGYMVAVVLGAAAMTLGGRPAVAVVLGLYGAIAFRAYRRWKAMVSQ